MRIDFRTDTGKLIGSVTELQFAVSWGALAAIATAIFTSGDTLFSWIYEVVFKLQMTDVKPGGELSASWSAFRNALVSPVFFVAKLIAGLVAFYFSTNRLVRGTITYVAWQIRYRFGVEKRLTEKKISDEFAMYPNDSAENYFREIDSAKRDAANLREASKSGIITNPSVRDISWRKLNISDKLSSAVQSKERLENEIVNLVSAYKDCLLNFNEKIRIHVSPVQPSVIYAIEKLSENYGLSNIEIIDRSLTGPQTINSAVTAAREKAADDTSIIMFVAPLSAYTMFDGKDPETPQTPIDLERRFEACGVIVREQQHVLILDDARRTPVRKNRLLYYNNSTAEECWSMLSDEVRSLFLRESVDSYDDYLSLLAGRDTPSRKKLRAGDAIITWPPLTSYFDGRENDGAYFSKDSAFEIGTRTVSRVLLFSEKVDGDESTDMRAKLAATFPQLLVLFMYKLHNDFKKPDRQTKGRRKMFAGRYVSLTRRLLGLDMEPI